MLRSLVGSEMCIRDRLGDVEWDSLDESDLEPLEQQFSKLDANGEHAAGALGGSGTRSGCNFVWERRLGQSARGGSGSICMSPSPSSCLTTTTTLLHHCS
eukprot:TRINITY_DN10019_c0_g1_i5.p1 TRINITY_DN10019_c0_g1~~TRINITY_DN10019_c0_g1_i5.p1  ORF type:complete len:115 (+),score=47.73 TRINITY_DN10019_c0_g1_i5:46-345(+)